MPLKQSFDIEVAGVPYSYEIGTRKETGLSTKCVGSHFPWSHSVKVACDVFTDEVSPAERENALQEVSRHELAHAFLRECGLDEYASDETLVTFLAINAERMVSLFRAVQDKIDFAPLVGFDNPA